MIALSNNGEKTLRFGWREWVALPALGLPLIKAKIDTGARTSALHAFELHPFEENGKRRIRFRIHPKQRNLEIEMECVADIVDERIVRDSGGHEESRFVIETPVRIGKHEWPIEITLTARDDMSFRMLLGRTAMIGRAIVDPSRSYEVGKKPKKKKTGATS
jgi:hypothetical protein